MVCDVLIAAHVKEARMPDRVTKMESHPSRVNILVIFVKKAQSLFSPVLGLLIQLLVNFDIKLRVVS